MKKYLLFILLFIQTCAFADENYQSIAEATGNNLPQQAAAKNPSILIFVSFSMPEKSLEAYLRDARKIHASVIIPGLIDNSFQKTFHQIARLVKSSGGSGVELNPLWFKKFDIRNVPAVVVARNGGTDFDVMTGDITLASALRIIRDNGKTTDIAQAALEKLQGDGHG